MSPKVQPVRGTQDILPELAKKFRYIYDVSYATAQNYGCEEIHTPIFEFSEVFHRTLGETSDVVSKETYTFTDRGGDSLTLRPEGTAGVARALISNGLQQLLPLKLFYSGPMFRYERPQKGRYRQFHQMGIEMLGYDSPESDAECIALGHQILTALGLSGKFQLEMNTLGDNESRTKHRQMLYEYLRDFKDQLSADSQIRLEKNPLRILDSKDVNDQKIVAGAPSLQSCLNDNSKEFFEKLQNSLKLLGIEFILNNNLVRGLDYYTHTVFEFTTTHLGAQSAILSGGRYDGLIEQMGGNSTPSVGWAAGIERLALLLADEQLPKISKRIAVICADDQAKEKCFKLTQDLRLQNLCAENISGGGNLGKKFKKADKWGANWVIIIGESELQNQTLTVKDLSTGQQQSLSQIDAIRLIQNP